MTRYREGKGKHGGTTTLSGEFVRNVDLWRKWAAMPMTSIEFVAASDPATRGRMYAVYDDGRCICLWREADAPGLSDWMFLLYARYHGAWHLAQDSLALVDAQRDAGKAQAAVRRTAAHPRKAAIEKYVRDLLRADPAAKDVYVAALVAERFGRGPEAMRKLVARLRIAVEGR